MQFARSKHIEGAIAYWINVFFKTKIFGGHISALY